MADPKKRDTVAIVPPGSSGSSGSSGKRRVLVADDEEALGRAMARSLGAAGFEVVIAKDGTEAIEQVLKGGFDVILSDIRMPGATGIDLLRVVRAYDLDVPVVLMTGNPDVESAVDAIELGALQYLCKPFSAETVTKAIERASRLHQLARWKRDALALSESGGSEAGDLAGLMVRFDNALATMWMAYQPIVSMDGSNVFGYEALMRTNEPALPHPGAVLAAAERLDRLQDLGRRVRELVAAGIDDAPADSLIFINLHTRDLLDPDLASDTAPLSRFAERVVLEITERSALENVKDVEARVHILRYMGFRIAIDDLGAGYAGLTSFAMLEPEFVKLDMSLVRGVHVSDLRQKLVRSLASVCGEMGKGIIAEGVESSEERNSLRALGCDLMQGYLFAKPARPFPVVHFN